ncbi:MAG: GNAT family N-acetyltransferase [Gemmatimonadales bacterium]|nr:MAG: GNAT family N-acetyltransferase [Gemmatimonadales bacterium]
MSRTEHREALTLRSWGDRVVGPAAEQLPHDVAIDCGWGRLIFAHTFRNPRRLAAELAREEPGKRDIAFYVRDPHVVLALSPQELFLDPSHTYRLWLSDFRGGRMLPSGFRIRRLQTLEDGEAVNRIYASRHMVTVEPVSFFVESARSRVLTYFLAEDDTTGRIIGTVTGVDHVHAFGDPENGSSLWCLAVDPQAPQPGVGRALVIHLAEHYQARGRAFMDLSVLHDNAEAIALYEQLGFQRTPAFCVKHKNPINEPLFIGPAAEESLNPYARIIVDEARRRGIAVEVLDTEAPILSFTLGGRTVLSRESLSELTSAVAMTLCDDKALTSRMLRRAGLAVPEQVELPKGARLSRAVEFLRRHGRVVVKPARGEQGAGVSVDVRTPEELQKAVRKARSMCDRVLVEQLVEGEDLRIVVIDYQVVAAAIRRPARVVGTGRHTIAELIRKQSRRREAATGGESSIPLDSETRRCVEREGYSLDDVLPAGETLQVRKTANLHTGGTIHDVTAELHPELADAAVRAAKALSIPVVGLDFIVKAVDRPDYVVIEANERPGLANHEPQPTAERFVDLLFPQTATRGLAR